MRIFESDDPTGNPLEKDFRGVQFRRCKLEQKDLQKQLEEIREFVRRLRVSNFATALWSVFVVASDARHLQSFVAEFQEEKNVKGTDVPGLFFLLLAQTTAGEERMLQGGTLFFQVVFIALFATTQPASIFRALTSLFPQMWELRTTRILGIKNSKKYQSISLLRGLGGALAACQQLFSSDPQCYSLRHSGWSLWTGIEMEAGQHDTLVDILTVSDAASCK